jgi:hypothetical protein
MPDFIRQALSARGLMDAYQQNGLHRLDHARQTKGHTGETPEPDAE